MYGEQIFDELQEVDKGSSVENAVFRDKYAHADWDMLPEEGKRQYCKDRGLDFDKKPQQAEETYVSETVNDIQSIYRIPGGSLLEQALMKYGVAKSYGHTQNAIYRKLNVKMICGEGYFDTGYGNDMIDHDLLGGTGDGTTTREFLEIINR